MDLYRQIRLSEALSVLHQTAVLVSLRDGRQPVLHTAEDRVGSIYHPEIYLVDSKGKELISVTNVNALYDVTVADRLLYDAIILPGVKKTF